MAFEYSIGETAVPKSNVMVHRSKHTGEKPFKCQQCNKAFTRSSSLKLHEHTHRGERPFKCHTCTKAFTQSNNLKVHERTHTGERPFKCQQCTKAFSRSSHLKVHEHTHTGERPYKCHKCNKTFKRADHLKLHEHTHTGERPFKCDKCNKTFKLAHHLKSHQRTHASENNSTSSNNNEIKSPFKNSHLDGFPQPNTSARNLIKIDGENGYSYQVYQNKFPINNQITYHREINQLTHRTARPFKCDKCNKDYKGAHDLRYHPCTCIKFPQPNIPARNQNTNDDANRNPFQLYPNIFPMDNQMTYHREIPQRTHTPTRPFKCQRCNKDYTEAHHLKYHPCAYT